MGILESTARTRELGNELKRRRKAAGVRGGDLATKLQWSTTKVSRIETGHRAADEIDVVFYLAHLGAKKEDLDEILPLCRDDQGFWMSERLRSLIFHESTASANQHYQSLVVPGLLQTEAYAMALISEEVGRLEAPHAVDVRMRRQRILHDRWSPAEGTFYIHEQALHLPVGGNRVMNEQLLQLVLLAEQPNITIRVVPTSLGERAMFGGSFMVFHYRQHRPLACQESGIGCLFVEAAEYVQHFQWRLTGVADAALGAEQSRVLLATVASGYDRLDGDAPDNVAEEQLQRERSG
jgi:transcriptional regulator with XRE-family HTH domain